MVDSIVHNHIINIVLPQLIFFYFSARTGAMTDSPIGSELSKDDGEGEIIVAMNGEIDFFSVTSLSNEFQFLNSLRSNSFTSTFCFFHHGDKKKTVRLGHWIMMRCHALQTEAKLGCSIDIRRSCPAADPQSITVEVIDSKDDLYLTQPMHASAGPFFLSTDAHHLQLAGETATFCYFPHI